MIAHLYQSHFKEITCLKLHGHLNTMFQHFMTFNKHFTLLDEKETEVLYDLYQKLEEGVPLIKLSDDKDSEKKTDSTNEQGEKADSPNSTTPSSLPSPQDPATKEENKENENSEANLESRIS